MLTLLNNDGKGRRVDGKRQRRDMEFSLLILGNYNIVVILLYQ